MNVVLNPVHPNEPHIASSNRAVRDVEDDDSTKHDDTTTVHASHVPPTSNSFITTTFLILNTMIGSGILNQPQVFMYSGVLGALIVFAFSAYYTWLGMVILVDVGNRVNILNYSELTKKAFGSIGEKSLDLFIVLYAIGGLMSYITIIGGTSSELFQEWGCTAQFCQVMSTTSFFVFVLDLPLCLVRFYGHYGVISVISMASIFLVLGLVVFGGPAVHQTNNPILLVSANGSLAKIGSVVFALGCAPATFHAYVGLQGSTPKKWNNVITHAVTIGALMCCVMGISGYLVFGNATKGEIIDNFPRNVAAPFKLLLIVHLILYIPIDFVVMRFSVLRLFGKTKGELPLAEHSAVTLVLLAGPTIVVLILRASGLTQGAAFGFILDFTGGIAASFTSFIMPSMIYLALTPNDSDRKWYWHAVSMLVFGVFIIITVPLVNILIISGAMKY